MLNIVHVLQSCVKLEGILIKIHLFYEPNINVLKKVLLRVEREVQFP